MIAQNSNKENAAKFHHGRSGVGGMSDSSSNLQYSQGWSPWYTATRISPLYQSLQVTPIYRQALLQLQPLLQAV